jgi:pilus assembly protein CpaF
MVKHLTGLVDSDEHLILCEKRSELAHALIVSHPHLIPLTTSYKVDMHTLLRHVLRKKPDRIIVDEVRGNEAYDFLTAVNAGHDGSFTTIHSINAMASIMRLQLLVARSDSDLLTPALCQLISNTIGIIIHVGRDKERGREVEEVVQPLLTEDNQIILHYLYTRGEGRLKRQNGLIQR